MNDATTQADEHVLHNVQDGIATVILNRPQARNALTFEMYDRLAAICSDVPDEVKVIVITGAGEKAFAAGTDISLFRSFSTPEDALQYEERGERVFSAIENCRVPTIAAISGACTGGGAAIAASCDLRIAAKNALFGFPIARTLGNCLSMANYARLVALLGEARTKDLILMSRLAEADECFSIGLYSEVLEDHAALMARAAEMADTLKGHAPLTMRATKQALLRLRRTFTPGEDRDLITSCYMSADFREGMEAFLNKRKPNWRGV